MADPITMGLAISKGIMMAAQIGKNIKDVVCDAKEFPHQKGILQEEISAMESALKRLQPMILGDTKDLGRNAEEIKLENLATVVMGTVMTLSELLQKTFLLKDCYDTSGLDRAKWVNFFGSKVQDMINSNKDLASRVTQLEGCILGSLRESPSTMAGRSISNLRTGVHRSLTRKWVDAKTYSYDGDDWGGDDEYDEFDTYDDPTTTSRFAKLRHLSAIHLPSQHGTYADSVVDSETDTIRPFASLGPSGPTDKFVSTQKTGLDKLLELTRVYRRAGRIPEADSFKESVIQSWSVFTDVSISAISSLSVIALPLLDNDLLLTQDTRNPFGPSSDDTLIVVNVHTFYQSQTQTYILVRDLQKFIESCKGIARKALLRHLSTIETSVMPMMSITIDSARQWVRTSAEARMILRQDTIRYSDMILDVYFDLWGSTAAKLEVKNQYYDIVFQGGEGNYFLLDDAFIADHLRPYHLGNFGSECLSLLYGIKYVFGIDYGQPLGLRLSGVQEHRAGDSGNPLLLCRVLDLGNFDRPFQKIKELGLTEVVISLRRLEKSEDVNESQSQIENQTSTKPHFDDSDYRYFS